MNPELPAEEEMKKPSPPPPWPTSLVSCELLPVADRKSAKKCSLPPLHGAVRPDCRGPPWMGNAGAGAWSQGLTGRSLALAESGSRSPENGKGAGRGPGSADSQRAALRGNAGLLGGVCAGGSVARRGVLRGGPQSRPRGSWPHSLHVTRRSSWDCSGQKGIWIL